MSVLRSGYGDSNLKDWLVNESLNLQAKTDEAKKKLKDSFNIDYDSEEAKKQVVKEGSKVQVLVNHMPNMKGGVATVKKYLLPAMLSDIKMQNGMVMNNHKWLINEEVKII